MHTLTVDDLNAVAQHDLAVASKSWHSSSRLAAAYGYAAKISPRRALGFVAHLLADFLISRIDKEVLRVQSLAISFSGLEVNLTTQMIATGAVLEGGLGERLEGMTSFLDEQCKEFETAASRLRKLNPASRSAAAVDRLQDALSELRSAIHSFVSHAKGTTSRGTESWELQVASARASFVGYVGKPLELSDVDDELLAMLDEAVERKRSVPYGNPHSIAEGLVNSRLH